MEIICRVADAKFRQPGICSTYADSVQKLLTENIFTYGDKDEWQEFRDKRLWTLDVNDILEANKELLR